MTHPTPQSPTPPIRGISQTELVRAAIVVVAILVGLQLLWAARLLVLTAFLGVLFGLATSQAVDWLRRKVEYRIRRGILAPLVVFGVVGLLGLVMVLTGPTMMQQSQELRTKLPEAVIKLEEWMAKEQPILLDLIAPPDSVLTAKREAKESAATFTIPVAPRTAADSAAAPDTVAAVNARGRLLGSLEKYASPLSEFAFGVLQSTVLVFAAIILVLFLAVYIAIDPGLYRHGILLLVPLERRERMGRLLTALANALRIWFGTQLLAMLVIGVVTTAALAIIGVRAAIPLGLIAGLFEFIPNIGPILSAIPAILMGFADSPRMALTVMALYWGIQFLENNLLIPYLMKEQLDLPPALTLVTQVMMAYVFGFLGLFVAIPMLAVAVVTVRMLWIDEDLPPFPTIEMAVARRRTETLPAIDTEDP